MTEAQAKLTARLEKLSTAQLAEISLRLTTDTSSEATLTCIYADRVLEQRMSEEKFAAHLAACDALLDAA